MYKLNQNQITTLTRLNEILKNKYSYLEAKTVSTQQGASITQILVLKSRSPVPGVILNPG